MLNTTTRFDITKTWSREEALLVINKKLYTGATHQEALETYLNGLGTSCLERYGLHYCDDVDELSAITYSMTRQTDEEIVGGADLWIGSKNEPELVVIHRLDYPEDVMELFEAYAHSRQAALGKYSDKNENAVIIIGKNTKPQ